MCFSPVRGSQRGSSTSARPATTRNQGATRARFQARTPGRTRFASVTTTIDERARRASFIARATTPRTSAATASARTTWPACLMTTPRLAHAPRIFLFANATWALLETRVRCRAPEARRTQQDRGRFRVWAEARAASARTTVPRFVFAQAATPATCATPLETCAATASLRSTNSATTGI